MRAIRVERLGDPEVMTCAEVPTPIPERGEVLVRVHAAGVNPVDTYLRAGAHGYAATPPYTPGIDGAGQVAAVGSGVESRRVGDAVYFSGSRTGSYAEFSACPAEAVHRLPPGVPFPRGAAVGVPYAAAYRALFQRARTLPGETVLVHGATGGVGLAAVQLARAAGCTVIGSAGDPAGVDLALAQGATHVLRHDTPGHLEDVANLTQDHGVDVIVEMLANENLGADLRALARGGRVVIVGSRGTVEIDPRDAMRREASILGMLLGIVEPAERREIYAALSAGLESGALQPVVGRELPLEQAAEAHRLLSGWSGHGKIVLLT